MSEPLFFLLLLLLPLFLSFVQSNGQEGNFSTHCPSYTCGDVLVEYPFWQINDNTTHGQYCGYPGFGLNCTEAGPIFRSPNDAYFVKSISYSDFTLRLVDIDVLENANCPRARHNVTLNDLPLGYTGSGSNLTFYFNCTERPPYEELLNIDCLRSPSGDRESYLSLAGANDSEWFGVCAEKVVATVMQREPELSGWADVFAGAMLDGFALNWRTALDCRICEESDGRCGYNYVTNRSLCICADGTIGNVRCNRGRNRLGLKIGIGLGAAAGTSLLLCVVFFIYQRRTKKHYAGSSYFSRDISSYSSSYTDIEKDISYPGLRVFNYKELEEATDNFDSKKELGDGGFGTVYKGKLQDGRTVAVKRLYENNFRRLEQFMNEVEILTRLRHPNLVSLYGCTSRHCRELLLVYEYISNGTIADHLHVERANPGGSLSWTIRMKIATETASALAYLHASDVVHRDVKSSNILLDDNFCVKVADFGLSRLFPLDVTHVSTAPQGTPGYVDPEYHECYQLTDKSDVYSFGVVLIELISSLPAVDITRHRHEINLSTMAINKIQNGTLHELVDKNLGFESDSKVRTTITAVAELAFQCLQSGKDMRPSMQEVLVALKEIQTQEYSTVKAQEMDIPADDAVLLKSFPVNLSPKSVHAWESTATTPNTSG